MSIAIPAASRAAEISGLRPYLMRVALSRLNDRETAEDAVQDTLAAAVGASASFTGRSTLRTWVTGILLHKVTDVFRALGREGKVPVHEAAEDTDDSDFDRDGSWRAPVTAWSDPERALECTRFRAELEAQIARLPQMQARAFVMREVMGLESTEICRKLGVTPNNLCVLLHRARLALRRSLDREWFSR